MGLDALGAASSVSFCVQSSSVVVVGDRVVLHDGQTVRSDTQLLCFQPVWYVAVCDADSCLVDSKFG